MYRSMLLLKKKKYAAVKVRIPPLIEPAYDQHSKTSCMGQVHYSTSGHFHNMRVDCNQCHKALRGVCCVCVPQVGRPNNRSASLVEVLGVRQRRTHPPMWYVLCLLFRLRRPTTGLLVVLRCLRRRAWTWCAVTGQNSARTQETTCCSRSCQVWKSYIVLAGCQQGRCRACAKLADLHSAVHQLVAQPAYLCRNPCSPSVLACRARSRQQPSSCRNAHSRGCKRSICIVK